jgi:DNA-binding transcriptional ArsR family regulator
MDGYDNDQPEMPQNHGSCQLRMSDEMLNRVASRFRTLGEPYRRRIFQMMMRGAMTVGEVVHALNGNQPNVSCHLQILYAAGMVRRRRERSSVVYSLKSASVSSLFELVYQNEMSRPGIQSE